MGVAGQPSTLGYAQGIGERLAQPPPEKAKFADGDPWALQQLSRMPQQLLCHGELDALDFVGDTGHRTVAVTENEARLAVIAAPGEEAQGGAVIPVGERDLAHRLRLPLPSRLCPAIVGGGECPCDGFGGVIGVSLEGVKPVSSATGGRYGQ
ncbi:hypothetical protein [Streptomyces luteolus]|uniref:hypothetical protein n=1 Tax=Streptomyces luteolus TaxID=3043615 RepID=UPI0032B7507A